MVARILICASLLVLGAGFAFFAGNVLWLGTKEFFKVYRPKKTRKQKKGDSND